LARITFTGISSGNLGDHVGDDPVLVAQNRSKLKDLLSLSKIIYMSQVHGNEVIRVNSDTNSQSECDALITTDKSVGLAVLSADCLPILVSSQIAVAAIHAGRKGIVNGIIPKTIGQMAALGATNFEAIIGPAICGDCYEVDSTMYTELTSEYPALASKDGRTNLDLISGALSQLQSSGVAAEFVHICTKESTDFYSYRRLQNTGRQAGVISL
jgi:YfiH family protein